MINQPPAGRLKTAAPRIPAASERGASPQRGFRAVQVIGLLAALVFCLVCVRWLTRSRVHEVATVARPPKIDVPAPAADPSGALPHATEDEPGIATVDEMARPWAFKDFVYKNRTSGENVPAVVVRLPIGSATQPVSYWAISLNAPFGNCRLEYITDLEKLKTDYGFRGAKHPMVGNPCSHTVFDPLKLMSIPGSVWVRGAMVQGSDLRPPLGIEVKIRGKEILAVRME